MRSAWAAIAAMVLSATTATAARGRDVGTSGMVIPEGDPTLAFTVDDVTVTEGNTGDVTASFTVRLSGPPAVTTTVMYATVSGTALEDPSPLFLDFAPVAGTLTFAPGVTSRAVQVAVHGDIVQEPDEFFLLRLRNPTSAVLGQDEGVARIVNDDGATVRFDGLERGADRIDGVTPPIGFFATGHTYLFRSEPYSSYEITVEGASGDLNLSVRAQTPLFALSVDATPVGVGPALRLSLAQSADDPLYHYIDVVSGPGACQIGCPDDRYRIRVRETTGRIARFNNTGNQSTVLILQNRSNLFVQAHLWFWAPDGTLLSPINPSFGPREAIVMPTAQFVGGQAGSITVTHDGPLGALVGKAVAIDPTSGLAFDAPLTTVPR